MSGPVETGGLPFAAAGSYYTSGQGEQLKAELRTLPIDYFVYSEKDVKGRSDYVAMVAVLRLPFLVPSCRPGPESAGSPAVNPRAELNQPGTGVYIQRVEMRPRREC